MKPDVNSPGPVEATQKPLGGEVQPKQLTPEQSLDKVGEKPTVSAGVANDATQPDATVVVPPPPPTSATNSSQVVSTTTAKDQFEAQLAQLPAEDNEVIEKVWIDKADEIVEKTKDDPYLEDEAQHSLSRAYLKKRFNLDVD